MKAKKQRHIASSYHSFLDSAALFHVLKPSLSSWIIWAFWLTGFSTSGFISVGIFHIWQYHHATRRERISLLAMLQCCWIRTAKKYLQAHLSKEKKNQFEAYLCTNCKSLSCKKHNISFRNVTSLSAAPNFSVTITKNVRIERRMGLGELL